MGLISALQRIQGINGKSSVPTAVFDTIPSRDTDTLKKLNVRQSPGVWSWSSLLESDLTLLAFCFDLVFIFAETANEYHNEVSISSSRGYGGLVPSVHPPKPLSYNRYLEEKRPGRELKKYVILLDSLINNSQYMTEIMKRLCKLDTRPISLSPICSGLKFWKFYARQSPEASLWGTSPLFDPLSWLYFLDSVSFIVDPAD
ncbi:hypothetical protein QAD02_002778 [Eretmocerus hayati]|uniref:Uncharacterized protein n=1 Tax=Eretmocerus hayati TaxID=131215 RepID=A0ACC2NK85_9HYME|nr:hypothetical protein QAD02_002778 [Eretmocerus hayati]